MCCYAEWIKAYISFFSAWFRKWWTLWPTADLSSAKKSFCCLANIKSCLWQTYWNQMILCPNTFSKSSTNVCVCVWNQDIAACTPTCQLEINNSLVWCIMYNVTQYIYVCDLFVSSLSFIHWLLKDLSLWSVDTARSRIHLLGIQCKLTVSNCVCVCVRTYVCMCLDMLCA